MGPTKRCVSHMLHELEFMISLVVYSAAQSNLHCSTVADTRGGKVPHACQAKKNVPGKTAASRRRPRIIDCQDGGYWPSRLWATVDQAGELYMRSVRYRFIDMQGTRNRLILEQ